MPPKQAMAAALRGAWTATREVAILCLSNQATGRLNLLEATSSVPLPPAIILGLEHPRAVAAISSLGVMGVPVIGVDQRPSWRAYASRHLKRKYRIGSDPRGVVEFLTSLGQRGGGVLIPTPDEYIMLVSQNHDLLARHFKLTVPPWDVLGPLMDIQECYAIGRDCGLKTPNIFKPADFEDLRATISELDFREHHYLLKTPLGTVPADTAKGRFTTPAGNDAQTVENKCLEIHSRLGDFPLIAEVIPGEADQCIGVSMIVNANHEAVALHCIRRLTLYTYSRGGSYVHPYELGANVYCESIHDHEAVEAALQLVRRARYVGAITVEFRRDPLDNSLVLIKADTRLVRATGLSRAIGQDLPEMLYRQAIDATVPSPPDYADGICWLWLTPYISTLWRHRRNGHVLRKLLALLLRVHRIRALAYWGPRDPMPFLLDLGLLLRAVFKPVKRASRPVRRAVAGFFGRIRSVTKEHPSRSR